MLNSNSVPHNATLSRRQFSLAMGALGLSAVQQSSLAEEGKRAKLLVRPSGLDMLETRSKLVLELDGELHIEQTDPKEASKIRAAEVKGKSTLEYFEKIAFADAGSPAMSLPQAAARRYQEAGVENWIAGSAASFQLRPECRQTRMLVADGLFQQFCPDMPLDAREVQLLHSPINTSALELLLPAEPARPDSKWTIGPREAQAIFNLDAVHKSTLQASIAKVEKGIASIELSGNLEATANSVPTRLTIKGNWNAEFGTRCAMVTWLGLVIEEQREISQAEPGFKITARVRLIRQETQSHIPETADMLRGLSQTEDPGRWLVRLQSTAGRYSMLTDRRWHMHLDSGEESVLRMVENDTVIAQCTVTRLTELDAGQQLTLEGLQADIRASLKEGFGSFLESSEKVTSQNLRLIRVVVVGELEEVPIQWIYNHLSDDSGRRMAMIFTMGGNVTDRFAAADEQMTSSFELLPEPEESQAAPTTAPKLTAEKAGDSKER